MKQNLRAELYQIAIAMVASNAEMKRLYSYLKTRETGAGGGRQQDTGDNSRAGKE